MQADGAVLIDMPPPVQFLMGSDPQSVREGLRLALEAAPLADLSAEDRSTAEIVLAEVLNNVVEHAYAQHPGEIRLSLSVAADQLLCVIEDDGAPMPGGAPPAGHLPEAHLLPEGGFGWHLIRALSTGLDYRRIGTTNRLSFSLPAELLTH